jgi:hypothetical protein
MAPEWRATLRKLSCATQSQVGQCPLSEATVSLRRKALGCDDMDGAESEALSREGERQEGSLCRAMGDR